jgi:fumarate hydratase subunit beta
MSQIKKISLPLSDDVVKSLKAGDNVLLSGELYTGRDAAHKRLVDAIEAGESLPMPIENQTIYYVGPAPARPGEIIGSAGPTTSYRMDDLTLPLLERGLKGMIGKGERADKVIEGMKQYGAVYFAAIGGAGALIASTIVEKEVIAYEDLGAEAIHRLVVRDFPAIVVIDSEGHNLYRTERDKYKGE